MDLITPWLVFTHLVALLVGMVLGILGFLFTLRLLDYDGRASEVAGPPDRAPGDP